VVLDELSSQSAGPANRSSFVGGKPTSLEVLGRWKWNGNGSSGRQATAGCGRPGQRWSAQGPTPGGTPESKAKDAKAAPERKRARNLSEDKRFKLFSGPESAAGRGDRAPHRCPAGDAKMQRFADGEVYFQLLENVRGVDVFVVQPTCYPWISTWWNCSL